MVNADSLQGYDFLNKFIPMLESLMKVGFTKTQAIKAMKSQNFVQDFIDTPEWFVSAKRLPKGYAWRDGEKYHLKSAKKCDRETYTFLVAEGDMYIKDFYKTGCAIEMDDTGELTYRRPPSEYAKRICVIKNWLSLNVNYVNYKLDGTPFFQNSLCDFWRKNGGRDGLVEPLLNHLEE